MFSTRVALHRLTARRLFWVISLGLTVLAVAVVGSLIASAAPKNSTRAAAADPPRVAPGQAKRAPTENPTGNAVPTTTPAIVRTPTPPAAPTATVMRTATSQPTEIAVAPLRTATSAAFPQATSAPTQVPTKEATVAPTAVPATATVVPTLAPTQSPTRAPTQVATTPPSPTATVRSTLALFPTATALPKGTGNAADILTAGELRLQATFNSIGVEVLFTGDANGNGSAELTFRAAGESAWRRGLDLWRTNDGSTAPGPGLYGSALLLEPDTSYEVSVTLVDPDGVAGETVRTGAITTRADNIPPAGALAPTHFVRTIGSDTNPGTSAGAAWRSLEQAVRYAPAGAVVQVGPGRFERPRSARALPLTLVAQYPAVNDDGDVINVGQQSVIDYGPSSVSVPQSGVWQRVTFTGPGLAGAPAGASYSIWKWANTTARVGVRVPGTLAYAASLDATPQRIARWEPEGTDLSTPAGWVEKLYTNQTYNFGWTWFTNADSTVDLYVRLPADRDPNTLYISAAEIATSSTTSSAASLAVAGPGVRLSGFRLRQGRVTLSPAARAAVIDHNLMEMAVIKVDGGKPGTYGADHVIEHNRIIDTNVWTDDHENNPAIPWVFIKGGITNANGTSYGSRLGETAERTAVWNGGGAHRLVVRRNVVEGVFNGVGGYGSGYDRYSAYNNDVHDNVFRRIADDALEPEHNVINWRAWNNRIEDAAVFFSAGPVNYGPIYLFRNEVWRIGPAGTGRTNTGESGASGKGFKYSGSSTPTARIFVLHNTLWTDDPGMTSGVSGAEQTAGGGSFQEAFYLRNNIFRFTKYAFLAPGGSRWDEDGNHFATTDDYRGLAYAGSRYTTDVLAYRSASGQGKRSNSSGNFLASPSLANPAAGDLTLPTGSPLIDAGVPVPNVSDRPGADYAGAGPDIGARER